MTGTFETVGPNVRELPLAPGGELELRLGSNRLRVRATDGDRVVIRGETDHDLERDVEITSGQGWIRVTDGPAGSVRIGPLTVRSGGHTPDLEVEVPRNVRVSARTLSGDIEAVGVAGPSRWQSASGDVRIGAEGGPLTIETVSGDVRVDAHAALAVTARTVSGGVKLRAPRLTALEIATTSGDVKVQAALDPGSTHTVTSVSGSFALSTDSEVAVELQTITGDIEARVPHRASGPRSRRLVTVGAGRVRVEVKTMSGDVRLRQGASDVAPAAPGPPAVPAPPVTPPSPEPPTTGGPRGADDDTSPVPAVDGTAIDAARLEILRGLERGDLDVDTASSRLAALDGVPTSEGV